MKADYKMVVSVICEALNILPPENDEFEAHSVYAGQNENPTSTAGIWRKIQNQKWDLRRTSKSPLRNENRRVIRVARTM